MTDPNEAAFGAHPLGNGADTVSPAAGARAADLGPALKQEGAQLADNTVASGADVAQTVGKAVESAASVLDDSLPMLAGYVRNAAQYTGRFADSLRDKKAEELMSSAITWSREQPLMALAGAAVLGFALSRVAKASVTDASNSDGAVETTGSSESKPTAVAIGLPTGAENAG